MPAIHKNRILNEFEEDPEVPPRSRLFSLKPESVGTSEVESLSSYISRLAQAHSVTTNLLLRKETGFTVNGLSRLTSCIKFFHRQINGHGVFVSSLTSSLSQLTGRTDLSVSTMSRWAHVLPLIALIRPLRSWCPVCYQDMLDDGRTVFDHLLWALSAVTMCPIHKLVLQSRCPSCAKHNLHLSLRSKPGYCSYSRSWLGTREAESSRVPSLASTDTEWQFWASVEVGKLLALAPLIEDPAAGSMVDLIRHCLNSSKTRYGKTFARSAGLATGNFNVWIKGDHLPVLGSLLRMCFRTCLSPSDFFAGNLQIAQNEVERIPACYPRNLKDTADLRPEPLSATDTERVLRAALGLNPPKPLKAFQRDTRWTTRRMRNHFPDLCRAVVDRYQSMYKKPVDVNRYRTVVESAITENPPPCLDQVAERAGCVAGTLKDYFPKLSKKIIARHRQYRYKLNWKDIEIKLGQCIVQEPPPSLRGIARDLNTNVSALARRFPEACKTIGARSILHRKAVLEEKAKALREDVLAAIRTVRSEDLYPSITRVWQHMKLKSNRGAVHQVMKDIRQGAPLCDSDLERTRTNEPLQPCKEVQQINVLSIW